MCKNQTLKVFKTFRVCALSKIPPTVSGCHSDFEARPILCYNLCDIWHISNDLGSAQSFPAAVARAAIAGAIRGEVRQFPDFEAGA